LELGGDPLRLIMADEATEMREAKKGESSARACYVRIFLGTAYPMAPPRLGQKPSDVRGSRRRLSLGKNKARTSLYP